MNSSTAFPEPTNNLPAVASHPAAGVAPMVESDAPAATEKLEQLIQKSIEFGARLSETHLQEIQDALQDLHQENRRLRQRDPRSPCDTSNEVFAAISVPREPTISESHLMAKNAQAELAAEAKSRLAETIIQQSHDAILVLDAGRCVSANQIACELFDCAHDDLFKNNFFELLTQKFSIANDDWIHSIHQQLATDGSVICELGRDTPAGKLWIELSLKTFEASGESNVLVVGHDISRQRKFQIELSRSHDFLHHTINSVQEPLSVKSADLKYVLANEAFCQLLNLPFERIKGRTFADLVGADAERTVQHDEATLETGEVSVRTEWLRKPDGSLTTLTNHRSRFHDPVTGAAFVVTSSRDVTAELARERRLRLLASVFECAHESVAILAADGTIFEANPEFMGTVGKARSELMGASLKGYVDWGTVEFDEVIQLVKSGTPWFGHVKLINEQDRPISCWLSLSPSRNRREEVTNLIAMFSDITQIETTRSELHRQALHDNLTSLPNRRYYRQRIAELIEADKDGTSRFGVSFLDLDDFKIVNDSLGHDAGDRLLIEVSRRIKERLGDDCFLARFGGDEFALLIPGGAGVCTRASECSDCVVEALSEPFQLGEHEVNVGVSVGTTTYPDDAKDVESLMRQADVAMYKAKEEGKNKVRMFSRELVDVIERQQAMLLELRKAIAAKQLHVVYQPKFDLLAKKVVGCEALLRWERADGSSVSPAEFIPLAEESGLINRLGDQMVSEVCQQASRWHKEGILRGPIAINLSPRQLREPQMFERFVSAIDANEIRPEWLELEITENAVMNDLERAVELMNRINDYGIGISIDDFGTGYSSLGYIKDFPIKILKLDNLFVKGLPGDSDAIAIAKTVLSLAHGLNLKVVAEGVETPEQLAFLRSIDCDMVQGYLISRPLKRDEYKQWLIQAEANGI